MWNERGDGDLGSGRMRKIDSFDQLTAGGGNLGPG